jgi:hypothetical protein
MIKLEHFLRAANNGRRYRVPHVRYFSEGGDCGGQPPKKSAREALEDRQREKVQQKPEMDEKDDTSFQDTNMGLKVLSYSFVVFGSMYWAHSKMQKLLE